MVRIFSHPQDHRGKDSDKEKLHRSTWSKSNLSTRTQLGTGTTTESGRNPKEGPSSPLHHPQGHTETCGMQRSNRASLEDPIGTGKQEEPRDIGYPGGTKGSGTLGPSGTGNPGTPTGVGNLKDKKAPHEKHQKKGSGQKKTEVTGPSSQDKMFSQQSRRNGPHNFQQSTPKEKPRETT